MNKTIFNVLREKLYDNYPVGGYLHIVLDDGNLEDRSIQSCIVDAKENIDNDKLNAELCIAIGEYLLTLSLDERKLLVNEDLYDRYEL